MSGVTAAVAAVHEQVHERAQQQQHVRQQAEQVGGVLSREEEGRYTDEYEQCRTGPKPRPATADGMSLLRHAIAPR
jgi:hypothetical protein